MKKVGVSEGRTLFFMKNLLTRHAFHGILLKLEYTCDRRVRQASLFLFA